MIFLELWVLLKGLKQKSLVIVFYFTPVLTPSQSLECKKMLQPISGQDGHRKVESRASEERVRHESEASAFQGSRCECRQGTGARGPPTRDLPPQLPVRCLVLWGNGTGVHPGADSGLRVLTQLLLCLLSTRCGLCSLVFFSLSLHLSVASLCKAATADLPLHINAQQLHLCRSPCLPGTWGMGLSPRARPSICCCPWAVRLSAPLSKSLPTPASPLKDVCACGQAMVAPTGVKWCHVLPHLYSSACSVSHPLPLTGASVLSSQLFLFFPPFLSLTC